MLKFNFSVTLLKEPNTYSYELIDFKVDLLKESNKVHTYVYLRFHVL